MNRYASGKRDKPRRIGPPPTPPPTPGIGVNELGQTVPAWPDVSKPDTRGIPLHESIRNLWRWLRGR